MAHTSLKAGDVVELTTERLAYGGEAVARYVGLAVFVGLAAPGERIKARIIELRKNFARAEIEQILEPSPERREAPCEYFGQCGGCQLQHLDYQSQLKAKVGFVRDALERIGGFDVGFEIPIIHAEEFGYRNRAQIKVDFRNHRIGFTRSASNTVCDVSHCAVLSPELDRALLELRAADHPQWAAGRVLEFELASDGSTISCEPPIGSLQTRLLQTDIKNIKYEFGAATFFQSNRHLVDRLVEEVVRDEAGELAIDLFAGVGLFTLQLARHFSRVVGVESDPEASRYAIDNIKANRIENVDFRTANSEFWLRSFVESESPAPDLIVLDPPRVGAAKCIDSIVAAQPTRITYVSCDPSTLARDLRKLVDSGYELNSITALDLFPQTFHVETVAKLRLG